MQFKHARCKTIDTKPGDLIRSFNLKIDKHDYVRTLAVSNDEKLIYVGFNWTKDIRVFNMKQKKEESIFFFNLKKA